MAEENTDQGLSGQKAQPTTPGPKLVSPEQPKSAWDNGVAGTIATRKGQYLIGSRPLPGLAPIPADLIVQRLSEMDGVEIVRRLRPRRSEAVIGGGTELLSEIVVARMDERRQEGLRRSAAPNLVIEPDGLIHYAEATLPGPSVSRSWEGMIPLPFRGRDVVLRIVGNGDRPLMGASVFVYGSGFSAQALTDASGKATVTFHGEHNDAAGGLDAVKAVYIKPAADHWDRFIPDPALGDGANLVRLRPLSETFPNFPNQRLLGWGQRLMKLDLVADGVDAAGVKIGLVDSGCDHIHPLLRHVTQGVEIVDPARPSGWTIDPTGHGTHCAGIIAAGDRSRAQGILGFAPGAELHVLKVLPGGRFSDLIAALDECIERKLDLVNIGVCGDQASELVALKFAEARQKGVACIVAAGGSGRQGALSAVPPGALAVSAVGKLGEFPPDTYHAQIAAGRPAGAEGLFMPRSSNDAPSGGVCAPGVAIVSTVPDGGYAARDGSSVAAAHITGLAAVLLAHHPLFQGLYRTRGEDRTTVLFETIRTSSELSRLSAALSGLQQFPGWVMPAMQAGRAAALGQSLGIPSDGSVPAYFASPVLMQLRAMGMI
jgi:subtilisin